MRLFARGPEVPAGIRSAVSARPLAAVETADGTWLVGTRDALHVVGAAPTVVLPWERVQRADWDRDTSTLQVEQVEDYGAPVRPMSFEVPEPGALLQLLRERVTASVVLQRRVDLARKRGFTVIARRPPSGHGEVSWAYQFDTGVDPNDPAVMAAAESALREAQESLGL